MLAKKMKIIPKFFYKPTQLVQKNHLIVAWWSLGSVLIIVDLFVDLGLLLFKDERNYYRIHHIFPPLHWIIWWISIAMKFSKHLSTTTYHDCPPPPTTNYSHLMWYVICCFNNENCVKIEAKVKRYTYTHYKPRNCCSGIHITLSLCI